MPADEARDRWPQFAFDTEVLWQPGAGVIDAEETVHAMVRAAIGLGATLLEHWPVATVRRADTGYDIVSENGEQLRAGQVVVAAGGWLPRLLDHLDLPLAFLDSLPTFTVMQEEAFHFPYREADGIWPTFIHEPLGYDVYGLPGEEHPISRRFRPTLR